MNYLKNSHVVDLVGEIQDSGEISKDRVLEITGFTDFEKIIPILDVISFTKDEDPPEDQNYNFNELSYFYKEYTNSSLVHQLCDKVFDDLVLIDVPNKLSEGHIDYYRDYVLSSGESIKATLASNYCPIRYKEDVTLVTDGSLRGVGVELEDPKSRKIFDELLLIRFVNHGEYNSIQEPARVSLSMHFDEAHSVFKLYPKTAPGEIESSPGKKFAKKVGKEAISSFVPYYGEISSVLQASEDYLADIVDEEEIIEMAASSVDTYSFDLKMRERFKEDQKFARRSNNSFSPSVEIDKVYRRVCRKVSDMSEEDAMRIDNKASELYHGKYISSRELAYISAYRIFTKNIEFY